MHIAASRVNQLMEEKLNVEKPDLSIWQKESTWRYSEKLNAQHNTYGVAEICYRKMCSLDNVPLLFNLPHISSWRFLIFQNAVIMKYLFLAEV